VHTVRYRENAASLSVVFHTPRWRGEPRADDDTEALAWKPVAVIEGDEFAWHIPGLLERLRVRVGSSAVTSLPATTNRAEGTRTPTGTDSPCRSAPPT
jgi:hypothetical protein